MKNPDVLAKLPKTAEPVKVEVSKPKKVSPVKLPPIPKERLEKMKQPLRPPPGFTRSKGTAKRFTGGAGAAPSVPPPTTPPPPATGKRRKDYGKERDKLKRDRDIGGVTEGRISTEPYVVGKQHFIIKKKTKKKKSSRSDAPVMIEKKPVKLTIDILAKTAGVPEKKIMTFMIKNGIIPNPDEEIKGEVLAVLSKEFGLETSEEGRLSEENLIPRSPIVTVMGHVDHGKTTLLDFIRKASVAVGEAGGITQSIGAYKVKVGDRSVVFIDTPGHEAFSAMRQEGANVTDVVILVVAATEGIKEQTKEAINMAKAAKVSIVVAANKMDLPGANIDKLKSELSEIELIPEDWGGSTIVVPISAKTGEGVPELLEMVSLQTDILELKMNKSGKLAGTVIESHMDKFVGPLATVVIQSGVLKVGDYIEAGSSWGRVKALYDDHDKRIKKAECVSPVRVMGFDSVPKPGQVMLASDKSRRRKTEKKIVDEIKPEVKDVNTPSSLDELFAAYEQEEATKLNVVIKTDSQGSLDAVRFALSKIKIKDVPVNIVYSGIGVIGDNDVLLAEASKALLIGFNVLPEPSTKKIAKQKGINLSTYNIIFELTDAVTDVLKGMVKPEFQDILIGKAEVREVFNIGGVGNIAGCLVHEGRARSDSKVKLMRNRVLKYESTIETLKHFKEDVTEVKSGYECGIRIKDFEDFKTGDILEFYEVKEVD
ncbi:MAG: translation initiation factor IF-2 [Caldisericia bacterium]